MDNTAKEDFSPSIVGRFTNQRVLSVHPSGRHSILRHLLILDSVLEDVYHTLITNMVAEVFGFHGEV
jgi:hypothetical protein